MLVGTMLAVAAFLLVCILAIALVRDTEVVAQAAFLVAIMFAIGHFLDHGPMVLVIFLLTCLLTVHLILRRPFLRLRLGEPEDVARRVAAAVAEGRLDGRWMDFKGRDIKLESYFLGTLMGPVLILLLGLMSFPQVMAGLRGAGNLNPASILMLFLSMVFMSIFLDITGFFEYCARLALRYARTSARRLFFSIYAMVSFLTIFTSNDIIVLTFTPFIYYFSREAGIDPKPYLIAEFFAANTWSMMLYIGNPTNILLATAFGLSFTEYLRWMLLPTVAAGLTSVAALYWVFRKELDRPLRHGRPVRPGEAITDVTGAALGLVVLGGCVVALAVAPYFGIDMWVVSLGFAMALLLILVVRDSAMELVRADLKRVEEPFLGKTLRKLPWTVVPFVLSLFVTVEALRVYGITAWAGGVFTRLCGASVQSYVLVYGTASALAANVLNNIPMTVAFANVIQGLEGRPLLAAVLATTIGSNLGANLTPIGALAGIMWMNILTGKRFKISFREFVYYGLLVTPLTLAASLGVLALEFAVF